MQFKKLRILFCFLIISPVINSQTKYTSVNFISPVDFPIYLSGNYGELRSTHFHAGIDIKTGGIIGKEVFSVESGYISRIKISANSYGKTIYINHNNGYTTVYAHLNSFNKKIDKYIKKIQYDQRSFEVNHFPEPNELIVKKGEVIGLTGNTGSSNGPHLHFEIRETKNQTPINPLLFNFNIKDDIEPEFYYLALYPLTKNSAINGKNEKHLFKLIKRNGKFNLLDTNEIFVSGKIGVGVELYDFLNNSRNKCGIYSLKMKLNNEEIYSHIIDNIPFSEAGYIKSHADYSEKILSNKSVQKLFLDPNNKLSIYREIKNKGIIEIEKDSIYEFNITAVDSYGNSSCLDFSVKGENPLLNFKQNEIAENLMNYNISNSYIDNEIKVEIPKNALYDSIVFQYSKTQSSKYFSNIHHIHNKFTPIHKKITISIKTKKLPENLKSKAFIAQISEDNEISPIGGKVVNGHIVSETNKFGDYVVMVDTISPTIELLNIQNERIVDDRIIFNIKDELSGIKSFNGFIDNNWALFEYDLKNDILFYILDDEKIKQNREHDLELFVIDNNNNVSTFYRSFYW